MVGYKKATLFFVLIISLFSITSYVEAATLDRNLSIGMSGNDVYILQKCLNESTDTQIATQGSGSPNNETTYFGLLTQQAVIKYQNKFSSQILNSVGLSFGNGFVGQSTRKHLNTNCKEITGQNTVISEDSSLLPIESREESGAPVITSINPSEGYNGTDITLTGKNFTKSNRVSVSFSSKDRFLDLPSNKEGTSLSFTLDEDVTPMFDSKIDELAQKLLGEQPGSKDCDKKVTYRKDSDGGYAHNSAGERIVEKIEYINCKIRKSSCLNGDNITRVNNVIKKFPITPLKIYVENDNGRSNYVEFKLFMSLRDKFCGS